MDIVFLFGHDHSKGETEFIKTPGEVITSTVNYDEQTTEDITLRFTYAHAGYITNTIGGEMNYSYITYDKDTVTRNMNVADGEQGTVESLTKTIERLEHPDQSGNGSKPSSGKPGASHKSPKTGDDTNVTVWVAMLILCGGTAVAVLPRKKHN